MTKNRLDALGDRLKAYESIETSQVFPPNCFLYVRIDGRSFSKFTKGLARPYNSNLSEIMKIVTKELVREYNAIIGFTQSDEINLVISNSYEKGCMFEAKKHKLISNIASFATSVFVSKLATMLPSKDPIKTGKYPSFDCRIIPIPNVDEIVNCIYWRERDAIKNSISMAAHENFSQKQLHGCSSDVMKDMLKTQKDIIWDDYPKFFKSGTYFKRYVFPLETGNETPHYDNIYNKPIRSTIAELNISLSDLEDHDARKVAVLSTWFRDKFNKEQSVLDYGNSVIHLANPVTLIKTNPF